MDIITSEKPLFQQKTMELVSVLEYRERAPVICNREIRPTGTEWSRGGRSRTRRSKGWDFGSQRRGKHGMISPNFSFFLLDRVEYFRRSSPHHRDNLRWRNLGYESRQSWGRHNNNLESLGIWIRMRGYRWTEVEMDFIVRTICPLALFYWHCKINKNSVMA